MDVTRAARIVFACGRPGSGKSHFVKQQLAADRPERLLVFDPEGEYDQAHQVDQLRDVLACIAHRRFAVSYVPAPTPAKAAEQFDAFCRVAWDCAQKWGAVTLAADELQQVTTPSRAPPWWAACVRRGRKHGLTIYAAAQRPAEIDKTIYSNATVIRTGGLLFPDDQLTIARAIGVTPADVAALTGHQWIMRDEVGQITKG